MTSNERDREFWGMAETLAASSTETGKRVGAVIVGPDGDVRTKGFNGLPRGAKDIPERHVRETGAKHLWSVHAEINAISDAARRGVPLEGCTIYTTHFPCAGCTKAIIQSGVGRVVSPPPDYDDSRWAVEWRISAQMFDEARASHSVIS